MTTELRAMGPTVERAIQLEEYLAHGAVILSNAKVGKTYNRVLQVEKMRQTPIDMQPRPYKISGNGIEVLPNETIFVDQKTIPFRQGSGLFSLFSDAQLRAGLASME